MDGRQYKVLGICGSLRKKSLNMSVLKLAGDSMPEDMTLSIADFSGIPLFNQDEFDKQLPDGVLALAAEIRAADAVLIATPEYNFSIPGVLKNAIDWVSRTPEQPFNDKPVAILSASMGPLGGARVQYDLRKTMLFLNAQVLIKPEVFVGAAHTKFTDGAVTDEVTKKFVGDQMLALRKWIARMSS